MKNKAFFISVVMIIVSFAITTTASLTSLLTIQKENDIDMSKVLAGRINDSINSALSEPIMVSKTLSYSKFVIELLQNEEKYTDQQFIQEAQSYLQTIKNGLSYRTVFLISEKSHKYITANGFNKIIDPKNDDHDIWYSIFLDMHKKYDLDVDVDQTNGNVWTVFVNVRVEDPYGNLLGVIGVGVQMNSIQDIACEYEQNYNVKINLVNQDGLIQMDTDEINIESAYLENVEISSKNKEFSYKEYGRTGFTVTKYVEDLGWFLIVRSERIHHIKTISRLIFWNVIIMLIVIGLLLLAGKFLFMNNRNLLKESNSDQMTGMLNRRAYEDEIYKMGKLLATSSETQITICIFDVNGLKNVNDNLGHAAGDELIRACANIVKSCVQGFNGKVFRIGGDEFAAILEGEITSDGAAILKKSLTEKCQNHRGTLIMEIALAFGYACSADHPGATIQDLVSTADSMMYEDKEAYYQQKGINRRLR